MIVAGADGIEAAVESYEPTVILDSLGGPYTDAAIACIANKGRLVVYGTSNDQQVSINLRRLYRKGVSLLGYAGLVDTPEEQRDAIDTLLAMMAAGSLHDSGRRRAAAGRCIRSPRPHPRAEPSKESSCSTARLSLLDPDD